ncbi:hypothetical protein IW261DRAFT_1412973 [Armillaria novae-zelandiae]|uniref:Uncharacterized protein n=1 Tax=Armillaria novae-zelandiae TaxID=153914 RepID=A0AA39PUV1_9AGAR|nr:hypothetical protein IW261DRAFT_1412973 [Armillaria novae-zelandiae]
MSLPQIPMDQQLDAPSNQAPLSNVSPKLASVIRDNFLTGASPTRRINFNFLNVPSDLSEGRNVPAFEVPSSQSSSQNIGTKRSPEGSDSERGPNKNIRTVPQIAKVLHDNGQLNNEVDNLKLKLEIQAQALTEVEGLKMQLTSHTEAEAETNARLMSAEERILGKQKELNEQRSADINAQEKENDALRVELACQAEQLRGHAEVVTEQEKLALQQEASDMRKQTQTHPAKLAELIATHSTETASLKRQVETKLTLESQRNTQLEAALKHHVHEVDQLRSKLDVSEEARTAAENNAKQYQLGGHEFEQSVEAEAERWLESDEFFQQRVQNARVELDDEEYHTRFINDARTMANMIHDERDRAEAEYCKELKAQFDSARAHDETVYQAGMYENQARYEAEVTAKEEAQNSAIASEQKRMDAEEKVKNLEAKIHQLERDVISRNQSAREVPAGPTTEWLADPSLQKLLDKAVEAKLAQWSGAQKAGVESFQPVTDEHRDKMQVDERSFPSEKQQPSTTDGKSVILLKASYYQCDAYPDSHPHKWPAFSMRGVDDGPSASRVNSALGAQVSLTKSSMKPTGASSAGGAKKRADQTRNPTRNSLLKAVRKELHLKFNIKADHQISTAIQAGQFMSLYAADQWLDEEDVSDPPTLDPLCPCWTHPQHTWNYTLRDQFTEFFVNKYPEYSDETKAVNDHFMQRLQTMKRFINDSFLLEQGSDKLLAYNTVSRRNARRNRKFQGRKHFAMNRIRTTDEHDVELETYNLLYMMVTLLGSEGTSSEESCNDGHGMCRVICKEWRNAIVIRLLKWIDRHGTKLTIYGNKSGAEVHRRLRHPNGLYPNSLRRPIAGLPVNFYDPLWLAAQPRHVQETLDPSKGVKLPEWVLTWPSNKELPVDNDDRDEITSMAPTQYTRTRIQAALHDAGLVSLFKVLKFWTKRSNNGGPYRALEEMQDMSLSSSWLSLLVKWRELEPGIWNDLGVGKLTKKRRPLEIAAWLDGTCSLKTAQSSVETLDKRAPESPLLETNKKYSQRRMYGKALPLWSLVFTGRVTFVESRVFGLKW